ncbi:asparagine synthase (glutamine-hydrolyzing) [Pseudodesulfovibrio sp. zrk46]|uniref:asparagine synthase (glutamine-hydrolyzing) n=1 Tax=Pseudodesulfovibrio sp. zrk46 TaxID=2725288 RepID=UPI00144A045D|nr:asparagine synthase (glutamine-hydrolyzing) [Pseudodesulfovibrio sp. zrk46]QJB56592.1 asparagine synthase (glutamine-hydrolyzing) [Pseudodesulfovibrio sp. zrk46]
MCGITGFLLKNAAWSDEVMSQAVHEMNDTLAHRGPDDSGIWVDKTAGVAFGHRRLSILDLSPLGHQPMQSVSKRYSLIFNGEVYNHLSLREELAASGYEFRGGSDTETMLAAFEAWGIRKAVTRFIGMFAFALWDNVNRKLFLCRDRMGIKPLYYGLVSSALVFGSELKAIRAFPEISLSVDREALSLFFRHNYIPAPYSIYKEIKKLEPGMLVQFDGSGRLIDEDKYWSPSDVWDHGIRNPFLGTEEDAVVELEKILTDAVGLRMLSDVPLGALLSGGIDSSVVTALMQKQSAQPVKTFSVGFQEAAFNEAEFARKVASHLGTDHTELMVSPQNLLDAVSEMPTIWDEPFADSSQLPTLCVSRLARQSVTVCLSGDGGDELFYGYQRYQWMDSVWRQLSRFPLSVRKLLAHARHLPKELFSLLGSKGTKIHWRLEALGLESFSDLYRYFVSHHKNPATFVLGGSEPQVHPFKAIVGSDRMSDMALCDVQTYLPDDILTKVDRASMATSLEMRVPILDHRVAEFASTLPTSYKYENGKGKRVLREVLYKHVPRELVERPKMGFGVPIERWLKAELRDWAEALLDENLLRSQGYLDAGAVTKMWREYLQGQVNWNYYLWDVLMFQLWLKENHQI